jgi:hypothetical protein
MNDIATRNANTRMKFELRREAREAIESGYVSRARAKGPCIYLRPELLTHVAAFVVKLACTPESKKHPVCKCCWLI